MSYKAFVASTFRDLDGHRAHVIDALQSAGFVVDPMEKWSAASRAPSEFSAARLEGCSLCILLVGFRRGHVPDGQTKSITQQEYDEAVKRDIDVLPFLLRDGESWPPEFDERESDPQVSAWRTYLQQHHGIESFGSDPHSVRVESAVARWVVEKESHRAERFRRRIYQAASLFAALVVAMILFCVYAAYMPSMRSRALGSFLAIHDAKVFNNSPNGRYEVARAIDSRGSLRGETKLSDELLGTRKTLDLLVNNAAIIHYDHMQNLTELLKRGVHIRLVLWDYSDANRVAYDEFCRAIHQDADGNRGDARDTHADMLTMQQAIARDPKLYPGTLEIRFNRKPLFYTMWLRDAAIPQNALGHISIHFYQGQQAFPSFRVSDRDGRRTLQNMHDEFEYAWRNSSERLAPPPPQKPSA